MKKAFLLAAAAMVAMPSAANAAVELELGLGIDSSGSIGSANFNLQRQAYINVLNDPSVLPTDGTVAVGVNRFGSSAVQIFPVTVIDNTSIVNLINALTSMSYTSGSTNISGSITALTSDIFGNSITSNRQLIDISTDGRNNIGNLPLARNNALAAGIDQINCIGIGRGANCGNVQAGVGSFSLQANNFNDFEVALRQKIVTEVAGVPEPSTWAMLLLGFFGIGGALRRRKNVTTTVSYA